MLTLDQHFASGYLPALAGAYFNLVLLLAQNADSPLPEVRQFVRDEVPRLRATGEGVVDHVRYVHALAELAGFAPPPAPTSPDTYFAWFEEVHAAFRARTNLHHRGEIAHVLGNGFGEMLCSWNVAVMVVRLLLADPGSPGLEQQWSALREDLQNARDAVLVHGHHPNAPGPLATLTDQFSDAIDDLLGEEPGNDREELTRLGRWLETTQRALALAVAEARAQLRADEATAEA